MTSMSTSPSKPPIPASPAVSRLFQAVAAAATKSGVFGPVEVRDASGSSPAMLVCHAQNSAAPAEYRLCVDGGKLYLALVTADRWLSQSIEAQLFHLGDKLEELLEEDLYDQGYERGTLPIEHFRSEDKLYTFRSPLPIELAAADAPESITTATQCLLGYEGCFRRLGDMDAGDEED